MRHTPGPHASGDTAAQRCRAVDASRLPAAAVSVLLLGDSHPSVRVMTVAGMGDAR
jgi:hypothetical protein